MGLVNITLTLDSNLVRKLRRIAAERDTTLTGMVREYLEQVAAAEATSSRKQRELERVEQSFANFEFKVGKRIWRRSDLYARS